MDAHRRKKHSGTQSCLTPDQLAKLDRLADLARRNPSVLDAIQRKLEANAEMEVFCLSDEETDALADKLGLES
jgi:hypothetical protein